MNSEDYAYSNGGSVSFFLKIEHLEFLRDLYKCRLAEIEDALEKLIQNNSKEIKCAQEDQKRA